MRTVSYNPQWYKAECDEDGIVEYQLNPLTNSLASDISGNIPLKRKKGKVDFDGGFLATMLVQCSLIGIRGLKDSRTADADDPKNEDKMKDLVLEFERVKIGLKKVKVLKKEFIDLLPPELYAEILEIVRGDVDLDDEDDEEGGSSDEQEEMDFTQDSAPPITSSVES